MPKNEPKRYVGCRARILRSSVRFFCPVALRVRPRGAILHDEGIALRRGNR